MARPQNRQSNKRQREAAKRAKKKKKEERRANREESKNVSADGEPEMPAALDSAPAPDGAPEGP